MLHRHSLMLALLNGGEIVPKLCTIYIIRHSLMLALLNGGPLMMQKPKQRARPALSDVSVTEWRPPARRQEVTTHTPALSDVSVTEWRRHRCPCRHR